MRSSDLAENSCSLCIYSLCEVTVAERASVVQLEEVLYGPKTHRPLPNGDSGEATLQR